MPAPPADLAAQITAQITAGLRAQSLPAPSPVFLQRLISARSPPPPLAALIATARARLLAADLTAADVLDGSAATLPRGAAPPAQQARLVADVLVQVLDVEDVARPRWDAVEELEAVQRGERTRGREIVRLPAGVDDSGGHASGGSPAAAPRKNATHRLVVQDRAGTKMHALELRWLDRLANAAGSPPIGEKLLLRQGAVVARGTVLLEPATCVFLGGRVEGWLQAWSDSLLDRLRAAAGPAAPQPT